MIANYCSSAEKDISNFVDLASSTLGEDDQAALKTRYLLNALTGYSPLIYDLDVKGTDYNDFIEICRKVWEAKDKNPQLVTNLVSIYFNAEGLMFLLILCAYQEYSVIKVTRIFQRQPHPFKNNEEITFKFQDEESAHILFLTFLLIICAFDLCPGRNLQTLSWNG